MILPKEICIHFGGKQYMEHNPFISLNDLTEITYSDLKQDKNGEEYITIYFETPADNETFGFRSASINYPEGKFYDVHHYTKEMLQYLLYHYDKVAKLAFDFAKEDKECRSL